MNGEMKRGSGRGRAEQAELTDRCAYRLGSTGSGGLEDWCFVMRELSV